MAETDAAAYLVIAGVMLSWLFFFKLGKAAHSERRLPKADAILRALQRYDERDDNVYDVAFGLDPNGRWIKYADLETVLDLTKKP